MPAPAHIPSAGVRLEEVSRSFGALKAVDRVSLDIPAGSFFSLLGPSGCGKSTTLRIISGFESPDEGRIWIGEEDVTASQARRRPTAMVFQNYALFPHMTVGENVAYGLRVRKLARAEVRERVKDALRRVDLEAFVDTPVTSLSGGQQQRTALARAVAIEPRVILFDEPLSNLDVALRHQTRAELKLLQHRLGLTSIYVTHDQEEAMALSDVVAVMRSGRIVQVGSPRKLYQEPDTAFVASFLGGGNLIDDPSLVQRLTGQDLPTGSVLAVRPEHVVLASAEGVPARVVSHQYLGAFTSLVLDVDGTLLTARISDLDALPEQAAVSLLSWRFVADDRQV
ncbi:MAG: ABC transporter ATP-binding protein [Bacteroidetes bacterium]|nr:ABC transporter ATP-binding protein [Bacteroidota bacterium]MDA0873809.1 ABC transporter ATP-binding protein [Bacteroidota bacterium]